MNRSAEGIKLAPYPDIPKDRIKDKFSARHTRSYMDFGKAFSAIE